MEIVIKGKNLLLLHDVLRINSCLSTGSTFSGVYGKDKSDTE